MTTLFQQFSPTVIKQQWFSNVRGDVLSGLVVALALIPEAIAFSIIAGVDPQIGLYASFCIAVIISFVGGRPAMISAATGAIPVFLLPDIPLNLDTLWIILPYSFSLAAVGLLESLMTATIVDEMTETDSDKNRECKGQGIANIITDFCGLFERYFESDSDGCISCSDDYGLYRHL
ncbi:SulP family inorganic anion transporter [Mannheimia haemolytica]